MTKQQEKTNRQQQMKIENEARNQQINEVSSQEVSDVNIDVSLMISLCGNMTTQVLIQEDNFSAFTSVKLVFTLELYQCVLL